jgi:hypothetical protein
VKTILIAYLAGVLASCDVVVLAFRSKLWKNAIWLGVMDLLWPLALPVRIGVAILRPFPSPPDPSGETSGSKPAS